MAQAEKSRGTVVFHLSLVFVVSYLLIRFVHVYLIEYQPVYDAENVYNIVTSNRIQSSILMILPMVLLVGYLQYHFPIKLEEISLTNLDLARHGKFVLLLSFVAFFLNLPYKSIREKVFVSDPLYISLDSSAIIFLLQFFLVCLIIPFLEEIYFRGFYQKLLSDNYGTGYGYVGSTFAFAFNHSFSILSIVHSLLMCAAYEKTKKLWAPVFVHISINLSWYGGMYILESIG